jgi:hypothetical protein
MVQFFRLDVLAGNVNFGLNCGAGPVAVHLDVSAAFLAISQSEVNP